MNNNTVRESKVLSIFKELAAKPELMAMAIHTTDFKGVPVEVAIVDTNEKPLYCFRCAIASGYQMQPGAQAFHGITSEDIVHAASVNSVLGGLRKTGAGAYSNVPPHVVAYDPRFIADAARRALKPFDHEAEEINQWFADVASDEGRDIKELYSYIAGKPSAKPSGLGKSPFSWVGLPAALKDMGVATDDLDNSAIGQARRVIRLIKAVAALEPADVPHLFKDVDPEVSALPSEDAAPSLERITFEGSSERAF